MRDDLLDAYAAVDRARAHIPEVEKEFEAWMHAPPYLLIEEPHPEIGQKLFKLEINRRFPPTINAGVGAIINSVRSSLDLLAASLAVRNGKAPNADRIFRSVEPIWISSIRLQFVNAKSGFRSGNLASLKVSSRTTEGIPFSSLSITLT
jgi:hypothetical protein